MAFEYFKDRPPMYSQGVTIALNMGGDINEIDRACRRLLADDASLDGANWYESWAGLATELSAQAAGDEAAGRMVSAGHKHRRASIYFIVAERLLEPEDGQKAIAYKGVLDEFAAYIRCSGEPVEFVEISYEETTLPGLFIGTGEGSPSPVVININGFDTFKELLYLRLGDQARARDFSMLIVDLPGVGEALRLRNLPARFDTEVPIAACVDYLEARPDVDADRIGLMGNSLAGYYGPRAASFEKRLKCCAAWGAVFNAGELFRAAMSDAGPVGTGTTPVKTVPPTQLPWVTGQEGVEAALAFMDTMTLEPVLSNLTVPLLVFQGEDDKVVPWHHAEQTVAAAVNAPRVDLVRGTAELGGAGHCSADNFQSGSDLVFDWVAEILMRPPSE